MITKIEFENYRIFQDRQILELAPITVLFGKNNVGKSAVLKLPALAKSILYDGTNAEIFNKTINGIPICQEYQDVIYRKGARHCQISVSDENGSGYELNFYVDSTRRPQTRSEEFFYKESPEIKKWPESSDEWLRMRGMWDFELEYIQAIRRIMPPFFYVSHNQSHESTDGARYYDRIVFDYNRDALLDKVSRWYETVFDGWKIELDYSREPVYSLALVNGENKNSLNDGGAGIIQSFPVIVAAASEVKYPRLIVVEEPETHLHPEAHGEMAEFLAMEAISSEGKKRFLIETHSINFILRLRALVAEGVLKPSDLAMYYVDFDNKRNCSSMRRIGINEFGAVDGWPKDVFQETLAESLRLAHSAKKARNENEL